MDEFIRAEKIGVDAINETYETMFYDALCQYDELTHLAVILKNRMQLGNQYVFVYSKLFDELETYIYITFTNDQLDYYIKAMLNNKEVK